MFTLLIMKKPILKIMLMIYVLLLIMVLNSTDVMLWMKNSLNKQFFYVDLCNQL